MVINAKEVFKVCMCRDKPAWLQWKNLNLSYGSKFILACVQTSPPPSGKNRERRRRFFS